MASVKDCIVFQLLNRSNAKLGKGLVQNCDKLKNMQEKEKVENDISIVLKIVNSLKNEE